MTSAAPAVTEGDRTECSVGPFAPDLDTEQPCAVRRTVGAIGHAPVTSMPLILLSRWWPPGVDASRVVHDPLSCCLDLPGGEMLDLR